MSNIIFDCEKGVIRIKLIYGDKHISVELKPSNNWFEATSVKNVPGRQVRGEIRYKYVVDAETELKAWFKQRLTPPPSHVQVSSLEERVTIAFYTKLDLLEDKKRKSLGPIDYNAPTTLHILAREIIKQYRDASIEAKRLSEPPPTHWYDLKAAVLRDWRKTTPCSEALRDFFSSVLGTALSWKNNRVPRDDYNHYQRLRPGIALLQSVQ